MQPPRSKHRFAPATQLAADLPSDFLSYEADGVTVRYRGRGNHSLDVGSAMSSAGFGKALILQHLIGYFEAEIVEAGADGCVLTPKFCGTKGGKAPQGN